MTLMQETKLLQLISDFGDVVDLVKSDEKYIVRINDVYAGEKEFNTFDDARKNAENKKSDLDFRHVLMMNCEVIEVAVYPSSLQTLSKELEGSKIIKISIAEANELEERGL